MFGALAILIYMSQYNCAMCNGAYSNRASGPAIIMFLFEVNAKKIENLNSTVGARKPNLNSVEPKSEIL